METGVVERRGLWLVLALVLLLRIPFFNQAIQGDDHTYLAEAQHALIDPLHPLHVKYVAQGLEFDLRGHLHPPLDAWVLAVLLAIFGKVEEIPFHAVYTVFSLVAVAAVWSLAQRFSPRPLWAALLFLAVPTFVVNGNSLETDIPFLALWLASIALFMWDWRPAAVCMVLAALTSYQAVLLTPILGVWVWLYRRDDRARWIALLVPPITIGTWQLFERVTTGALPAQVLAGYVSTFHLESVVNKIRNCAALAIHFWFIVFPALLPGALLLAWRKRNERDTQFLLAWTGIFFAAALAAAFAGSARYLLPIAAPLAILTSRLRPRWLAIGFAAQMILALGLAIENYQHWDAYRRFAASMHAVTSTRRVWIDADWGLRYYLENDGGLPLVHAQRLHPGDIIVSSALGHPMEITAPVALLAQWDVRPAMPLRIFGVESKSGYSDASRGLWPFGIGDALVDRVRTVQIMERHPALEFFSLKAPEAAAQIVSGIDPQDHWMGKTAEIVLKSPESPKPLRVEFYISDAALARRLTMRLDGREIASQTYPGPGAHVLQSEPVRGSTVQIEVDRTFRAPGDLRDLGVVLMAVGFQ